MQESFTHEQLVDCGHGRMFGPGNAQLPLPPMLMFDRIVHVCDEGGEYGKGETCHLCTYDAADASISGVRGCGRRIQKRHVGVVRI